MRPNTVSYVVLLGTAAIQFSCGATIDIPISEESEATIEGATPLETLVTDFGFGGFVTFDVTSNQELQNQGIIREQIAEIKMTQINLTVIDPVSGQDLSFLDSLEFYVEAKDLAREKFAIGIGTI